MVRASFLCFYDYQARVVDAVSALRPADSHQPETTAAALEAPGATSNGLTSNGDGGMPRRRVVTLADAPPEILAHIQRSREVKPKIVILLHVMLRYETCSFI